MGQALPVSAPALMGGSAASLVPCRTGKLRVKILRGFPRVRKMHVIEDPTEDGGDSCHA